VIGMRRLSLVLVSALVALGFDFLDPVAQKAQEGNALYHQDRFAEALAKYREAQVDRPEEGGLQHNVGDALYREGAFDEAIAAFGQAGKVENPGLAASAYHNLGNAHFRKQDFESAAAAYQKALTLDPDQLDTKINLEMANEMLDQSQQQKQDQNESGEGENEDKESEPAEKDQDSEREPSDGKQGGQEEKEKEKGEGQPQPSEQDDQSQQREREAQPEEGQLSPEEAQRLLDAMKDREADAQKRRKVQLVGPRYKGKAW
jgi:Ca-activated chloride channel family protein